LKITPKKLKIEEKPALFNDYLFNFDKLDQFFFWNPAQDWDSCFEERLKNYQNRSKVKDILISQNQKWTQSKNTFENIEKLGLSNALAIVTGQQVGLFGGPLYSLYKAITTIKLSEKLQEKYPDYHFVPLFWLEAGDNDFAEINRVELLDAANNPVVFSLPVEVKDQRSVSLRKIPEEINTVFQKLEEILPHSDFRDEILETYKKIYSADKFFHDAFAEWLQYLLAERGLVIINAAAPEFGDLNKQIFKKAVQLNKKLKQEFGGVNQELSEKGYHHQITWGEEQTLLFRQDNHKNRKKVEAENEKFTIAENSETVIFTEKEILSDIEQNPALYTPNVALRPILQDFLLPTVAYIAGPGEISYAAQLKPLYQVLEVPSPVFYPRVRITLIENKINRLIDKFNFTYDVIFASRDSLTQKYVSQISNDQLGEFLNRSNNKIDEIFLSIKEELIKIDPTLQSSVEKTAANVQQVVKKLEHKANQAFERKMSTELSQIEKINNNIFPEKDYQERKLNALQYLSRYGKELVDLIYNAVDIEDFSHQLLILDN